jgi:hypothetical protein
MNFWTLIKEAFSPQARTSSSSEHEIFHFSFQKPFFFPPGSVFVFLFRTSTRKPSGTFLSLLFRFLQLQVHELIDVSDSEEEKTTVQRNAALSSHATISSSEKMGTGKVEENSESIFKCESMEVSSAILPDLARKDSTRGHSKAVGQPYRVGEAVLKENGGNDVKVMGVTDKSAVGLEDRIEIAEVMSLASVQQSAAVGQCRAQRSSGEPLTRLVRGGEVEKERMEVPPAAAVVQPSRPDLCHSLQHLYRDHANSILEFSHKE